MMKNKLILLLCIFMIVTGACVFAEATEVTAAGLYDISDPAVITSVRSADNVAVQSVTKRGYGTYYPEAQRFSVNCSGVLLGKEYAVFVLSDEGKPTEKNTVFVDQKTAQGTTICFTDVFPTRLEEGVYRIYVTGEDRVLDTIKPLATFRYHQMDRYLTVKVDDGDGGQAAQVRLWRNGVPLTILPEIESGVFQYAGLTDGDYKVEVSREGFISRTELFKLSEDKTLDIAIYQKGDVDGNRAPAEGNYGVLDMQCLYTYLSESRNTGAITGETDFRAVADVNGDAAVNILDYQCLYEMLLQWNKNRERVNGVEASGAVDVTADNLFKMDTTLSPDGKTLDMTLCLNGKVKLCGFDLTLHYDKNYLCQD